MTDRPALTLDLLLRWIRTSCQFCTGLFFFLVRITGAWATAPHVPAINVHMVYQRKAKHAISVSDTVQPEVKAQTPSVMKEVSVHRSNSSDPAVQNCRSPRVQKCTIQEQYERKICLSLSRCGDSDIWKLSEESFTHLIPNSFWILYLQGSWCVLFLFL